MAGSAEDVQPGALQMLLVMAREYKVMLEQRAFSDAAEAVERFWDEARDLAQSLDVEPEDEFNDTKERLVLFLDTPSLTLRANGWMLRQRSKDDHEQPELTLKCRSEDQYVAAAAEVHSAMEDDIKFEEDIAAPFRVRYAHSNTVAIEDGESAPRRLDEAGRYFPALRRLLRDGVSCPPDTVLQPVNNVRAFERVFTGPKFDFGSKKAKVALILWSNGQQGRPLVAEFSFRYGDKEGEFSADVALHAMNFFRGFQRLDWCRPEGMTKTEYVYRTTAST